MSLHYIKSGYDSARERPALSAIVYVGNLIMGLILSIPVFIALSTATSESGFSEEMAGEFDLALWADMLESSGPLLQTLVSQLLWVLPLLFVWKMASSAGLVHAQSEGGGKSFWTGVGRYTGKATLLGMLYMVPTVVVLVLVVLVAALLSGVLTGEVGSFWVQFVFTPIALFLGVAFIDMMHDYGRIELIVGKKGVMDSWLAGFKWPLHSSNANSIYIGWMVLGMVFLILPFILDVSMGGLFLAFIVQQILLFGRAFITVGWINSEVAFYEDTVPAAVELDETEGLDA